MKYFFLLLGGKEKIKSKLKIEAKIFPLPINGASRILRNLPSFLLLYLNDINFQHISNSTKFQSFYLLLDFSVFFFSLIKSVPTDIMVAELIDGKAIALDLRTKIHDDIAQFQLKHPEFKPHLSIIQVGDRPDSNTYVKMKLKAAEG